MRPTNSRARTSVELDGMHKVPNPSASERLLESCDPVGPSAAASGWVPSPRYLHRRWRVLKQLANLPIGSVLEVGSGAGMLLHELTRAGFACTALETSEAARAVIERLARENAIGLQVAAAAQERWNESFDVVIAMEVLEHIPDDVAAVRQWLQWLRPGGTLIVSVPAHMRRWGPADVWAGHCRRYEKDGLKRLLGETGFTLKHFESYGFPVANVIERLSQHYYKRTVRLDADGNPDREANNARSGIDRANQSLGFRLLRSWPGRIGLRLSYWIQDRFLGTDLGNGYIAVAQRR